jgi:hypothetical protein
MRKHEEVGHAASQYNRSLAPTVKQFISDEMGTT